MPAPSLLAHLDASKDSTALSLAYASVGDDGCTAIARYMRENVMLRTLDLRGNNIRADGLVVLAHGLRTGGGNMTSVCFKWNQIGSHPRGIQAFCDVLKENQSITHVDLRNNKIGTDCGPFLGDMLRENCTLTHLDLSWNDLGVEGGKALLDGLQANHSLIDCQLSGNRLAEDTLHAIAFILRRNRQTAPMGASTFRQERAMSPSQDPGSPMGSPMSPMSAHAPTTPASPGFGSTTPASPGFGTTGRSLNMTIASEAQELSKHGSRQSEHLNTWALTGGPANYEPSASDSGQGALKGTLKLLQREQNHSNVEDARFFGEAVHHSVTDLSIDKFAFAAELRFGMFSADFALRMQVAEYIDLLQLDVARNKKYRMDAEERERVVTKGFMEREMRYAQEMRELRGRIRRTALREGMCRGIRGETRPDSSS
ncbi:LRRC45 [Symbiodinium sp. CCMP2592]|nr:LRRC45 [Symbiodinium sp. CCMP2592]